MPDDDKDEPATPQRRWTIDINVGGDTLDDAVSMLKHFIENIRQGSRSTITGGHCRCGAFTVVERPDVTHDSHAEALEKWLEEQHAE